jgi:hypothetical protein
MKGVCAGVTWEAEDRMHLFRVGLFRVHMPHGWRITQVSFTFAY